MVSLDPQTDRWTPFQCVIYELLTWILCGVHVFCQLSVPLVYHDEEVWLRYRTLDTVYAFHLTKHTVTQGLFFQNLVVLINSTLAFAPELSTLDHKSSLIGKYQAR